MNPAYGMVKKAGAPPAKAVTSAAPRLNLLGGTLCENPEFLCTINHQIIQDAASIDAGVSLAALGLSPAQQLLVKQRVCLDLMR